MESTYSRIDSSDRMRIEEMINECASLASIAEALGKDATSISREVRRNRVDLKPVAKSKFMRNPCAMRAECKKTGLCSAKGCSKPCSHCERVFCHERCSAFKAWECARTKRWPYVCNRCIERPTCPQKRFSYDAARAGRIASMRASQARRGFGIDAEALESMDSLVSPLLKKGQSPYHIWNNHREELGCCLTTFYAYVNAGILSAGRMHLSRAVRWRTKRKKGEVRDKRDFANRTYADYVRVMGGEAAMSEGEELTYLGWDVEFDTVIGRQGGKALLTFVLLPSTILFARLIDRKDQACVASEFDWLERVFKRTRQRCIGQGGIWWFFSSALTDRGSEMGDYESLERSLYPLETPAGETIAERCRVFYCDPYSSWQKPHIEQAHTLLRRVLPKGTSFDGLTQADVDLVCSHIDSYSRENLGGATPLEIAPAGFTDKLACALGIRHVNPDDICLNPRLLDR